MPKDVNGTPVPYDTIQFKGIKNRIHQSEISGTDYVEWLGKPVTLNLPVYLNYLPDIVVYRPEAYWIPAAWDDVIKRLRLHGIQMETIEKMETLPLEFYRIDQPEIMNVPNEGHIMVKGRPVAEKRNEKFLPGSVRIPTDQPLGDLAILLLEPGSDQSFFQWGFFMPIFSRTEYIEGYMIEPIAADMLKKSPELKKEFEEKLKKSPEFANNPKQRLQWFYEKTPYYDEKYLLYPVGIER